MKPKWGFLPSAEYIHPPEAAAIKSEYSRYRLHQHLRGKTSGYEPLDLYSGDEGSMKNAMKSLWELWEESDGHTNSWRVFVDGRSVHPDHVSRLVHVLGRWETDLLRLRRYLDPIRNCLLSIGLYPSSYLPSSDPGSCTVYVPCNLNLTAPISPTSPNDSLTNTRTQSSSIPLSSPTPPRRSYTKSSTSTSRLPMRWDRGLFDR